MANVLLFLTTNQGRGIDAAICEENCLDQAAMLHETGAFSRIAIVLPTNDARDHFTWTSKDGLKSALREERYAAFRT